MGLTGDVYSGGSFVYSNNGSNFAALNSSSWDGLNWGSDAAFKASFGSAATPIPTPALLPGLVSVSAALLRKRKQNQGQETAETAEV